MGGKAALLLLIGFSSIMLMVGLNMNIVSTSAVENSAGHFESQTAKEIARSGINLASSNLSRDKSWTPSSPYDYLGTNNLSISLVKNSGIMTVTSVGTHEGESHTIEVKIELAIFSEFAYFSNIEGNIWWTATDTVWGPFHTNDDMQVQGHPYFAGPSTSHGGAMKYYSNKSADDPTIIGTYSPGTTIEIPSDGITDLAGSASSNGYTFSGHSEVFLEFAGDSIRYKYSSGDSYTTVLGSDLAPNGVIYVNNGDLRIQGTVKGKWSIGCNDDVFIDDDIVYYDVPDHKDEYDPSNDLLGIIAQDDVLITDNTANSNDVNIHAAIYCQEGSFGAENHRSRAKSGTINLIGGITQEKRGGVGTFSTKNGVKINKTGFKTKNYKYDSRLLHQVPPFFPSTNVFKILSWLE